MFPHGHHAPPRFSSEWSDHFSRVRPGQFWRVPKPCRVSLSALTGVYKRSESIPTWQNSPPCSSRSPRSPRTRRLLTSAPTFDVAAIRQTDASAPRTQCYMRGQAGGQTFTGRCIALSLIIKRAYRIVDGQLSGGPDWINTMLIFDFEAKTDRPTTRADVEPLFQSFLADRFNLKMHTEPRTMARRWVPHGRWRRQQDDSQHNRLRMGDPRPGRAR